MSYTSVFFRCDFTSNVLFMLPADIHLLLMQRNISTKCCVDTRGVCVCQLSITIQLFIAKSLLQYVYQYRVKDDFIWNIAAWSHTWLITCICFLVYNFWFGKIFCFCFLSLDCCFRLMQLLYILTFVTFLSQFAVLGQHKCYCLGGVCATDTKELVMKKKI